MESVSTSPPSRTEPPAERPPTRPRRGLRFVRRFAAMESDKTLRLLRPPFERLQLVSRTLRCARARPLCHLDLGPDGLGFRLDANKLLVLLGKSVAPSLATGV